jgi:hypothetical protein
VLTFWFLEMNFGTIPSSFIPPKNRLECIDETSLKLGKTSCIGSGLPRVLIGKSTYSCSVSLAPQFELSSHINDSIVKTTANFRIFINNVYICLFYMMSFQ